jgi:hypothetical protein
MYYSFLNAYLSHNQFSHKPPSSLSHDNGLIKEEGNRQRRNWGKQANEEMLKQGQSKVR